MEIYMVSQATIYGIYFSLLVSLVLPTMMWLLYRMFSKRKGMLLPAFAGISGFLLSTMLLQSIFLTLLVTLIPWLETSNALWVAGPIICLSTGVFEEGIRFLFFTLLKKSDRGDRLADALSYGIGYSGIGALYLTGFGAVTQIAYAMAINSGEILNMLASVSDAERPGLEEAITFLTHTPPLDFFMAGFEQLSTIILQITLSVLMWIIVQKGFGKKSLLYMMGVHAGFNFLSFALVNWGAPLLFVELVLLAVAVIFAFWVKFLYQQLDFKDKDSGTFTLGKPLYKE